MTSRKKKIVLGALAALLIAGYLCLNFGSMLTRTAEKIASDALGVEVSIGSIDVALSDKKVTVNTIKIANPPGYHTDYAVMAEKIVIGLNTANSELVDFKNIEVMGSVVNLEINEKGINLMDLKNLAGGEKQKEAPGSKQVRVIIEHMVIDASVINPRITIVDRNAGSIRMPPVKLSGLGQGGGGMQAGDAVAQVMTKYLSEVMSTVRDSGMLTGISVPGLNDVKKTLDGAAEGLKGLFR